MEDFGFDSASALLVAGTRQTVGLSYEQLQQVARSADVLINISGMLMDEELTGDIPCRVYLDLDPAFNQLWHASAACDMRFGGHTHFVTIGLAIGRSDCPVPTCDLPWITTLQPVVLSFWPVAQRITHDALTTVGHWRSYGSIEYEGRFYGQKAHSLRRFITLPTLTDEKFLLALAIHPKNIKIWQRWPRTAGTCLTRRGGPYPRRLSAVHPGLKGGVRDRQERLCGLALRLDQRSQSLLPGFGPPGPRGRDRLQRLYSGGRGAVRVRVDRGYTRRHRGTPGELRPPRAGGAGHRRRVVRLR